MATGKLDKYVYSNGQGMKGTEKIGAIVAHYAKGKKAFGPKRLKYLLFIVLYLWAFKTQAQEADLEHSISDVSLRIEQSQQGERLLWMDSLTTLVEFNTELKYDSIVRQTIAYALQLDSLHLATRHTAQYIFYKNKTLGRPTEGIVIFDAFLDKVSALNDENTKSTFYFQGAHAYYAIRDLDNSLRYFKTAKELAQIENPDLLGKISSLMGGIYIETGKSSEASQELQTAINIFRQNKDTLGIIDTQNNISILYSQHAFYKEAEKERNEAIALIKQYGGPTILSLFYFNAAEDYRMTDNQSQRIKNIKLALAHNDSEHKAYFKPFFLYSLTIALAENDSIEQAENAFNQIINEFEHYKEEPYKESYIAALKELELARGNYGKALSYGKQHLKLKKENLVYVEIINAEKFLSEVYKKLNDEDNSKRHLLNYYTIKDSITNVQNAKNLLLYQTLYETEKRDYQIDAQKTDIALLNSQNKVKNQWLLFGGTGLLSIFGFVMVFRSRNVAKRERVTQENFSHDLISAQENERNRVSKDLHDSVGQQLTFIKRKAQNLNQEELSVLANKALEEVRSISRDLYPVTLKQLGLKESIEQLLLAMDEETAMFFSVEIDDINTYLNAEETLNVYRFIQESVSNVLKHSEAKTLIVNVLRHEEAIEILIKDNGKGFEATNNKKRNSLGLKTMAERIRILKGSFTITSLKDIGTTITVKIPV